VAIQEDANDILRETSRTFFIPISRLPPELQEAVASAYLCLRAIDEVEDHSQLDNVTKSALLRSISSIFQSAFSASDFAEAFSAHKDVLPEVTLRVNDWAQLAPRTVAPRIWEATATMADRMARWADDGWSIRTETDLDRYTFGVAGSVGLLLSDLWGWFDGTQTSRVHAVGFGRGLQAVNILLNHDADLARGVEFFPPNWQAEDMNAYARRNLALADAYTRELPPGPVQEFCTIPLVLAYASIESLEKGERKLSRSAVLDVVAQATRGRH
jgi:farnesyl-diphosphate farnesyltransferase